MKTASGDRGLTTTIRLFNTKIHATLDRTNLQHTHGGRPHTETYAKKYMIFSCNKMAASDRRPLSLIFTEEENMVLYTAIPNRINSKSVAARNAKVTC